LGFVEWLFGLFFGKKQEKPAARHTMKFADFDAWLAKHLEKEQKQLLDFALPKFAEIKHLLKQSRAELDALLEKNVESEQGDKRLRKIVGTSQKTFVSHMKQLLEKLQPPVTAQADTVRDYCTNALPLLEKEIGSFGKNIAYTSIILKEEVHTVGANIKELQAVLKALHGFLSEKPVLALSRETRELQLRLSELFSEQLSLSGSIEEANSELQAVKKKIVLLETELLELGASEEARVLEGLETAKKSLLEQKEKLRSELVDLLAPIDKPLRRLESLAVSGAFPLAVQEKEFLRLFLRDPLLALKQDPRADDLKKILKLLKSAIDNGAVSLKDEKEKEKRLLALDNLSTFDFFGNFFWKSNQLEVELQKTEKELLHNKSMQQKALATRGIASAKKELEEKTKAIDSMKKKQSALEETAGKLKAALENIASKISGKEIQIELK